MMKKRSLVKNTWYDWKPHKTQKDGDREILCVFKKVKEDRKKLKNLKTLHNQIKKHFKRKEWDFIDPIKSFQNLLSKDKHILIFFFKSSHSTFFSIIVMVINIQDLHGKWNSLLEWFSNTIMMMKKFETKLFIHSINYQAAVSETI